VRRVATEGCSGPKLLSPMTSARRSRGSASARRLLLQQLSQVAEVDGGAGVIGAEALLIDGKCAPIEGFSFGQPVADFEQKSQVVGYRSDAGMVRPHPLLGNGKRAAKEGLGLGNPVGGVQQPRELVEGNGMLGRVSPMLCGSAVGIKLG